MIPHCLICPFLRQYFRWMSYLVPGARPLSCASIRFALLIVGGMLADRIEPLAYGLLVLNTLWTFVDCETNTPTTLITDIMIMILQ
jgi:hypothetical protein